LIPINPSQADRGVQPDGRRPGPQDLTRTAVC
jgi:hypothetical protein